MLLEEDLRNPCTEEITVFRAFVDVVAAGEQGFVVVDTAPTGHTFLLLDAAETYHREVERMGGPAPGEVRQYLPRPRDLAFTKILLVTLPQSTQVHEAAQLQADLARTAIRPLRPFAWVVNQRLVPLRLTDALVESHRANEVRFLAEVVGSPIRPPWSAGRPTQLARRLTIFGAPKDSSWVTASCAPIARPPVPFRVRNRCQRHTRLVEVRPWPMARPASPAYCKSKSPGAVRR